MHFKKPAPSNHKFLLICISAAQNLILISTYFDEGIITILYNKYAAERRFFSFKLLALVSPATHKPRL